MTWVILASLLFLVCIGFDKCVVPTWNARIAEEHQMIVDMACATFKATWENFECNAHESHPYPVIPITEHLSKQFSFTAPSRHYVFRHFSSLSGRKRMISISLQARHPDGTLIVMGAVEIYLDVIDKEKLSIRKIRAREHDFSETLWKPDAPLVYTREVNQ